MEKIGGENMRAMDHVKQIKEQGFTKLDGAYDIDKVEGFKNCIAEYSTNHSEVSDFIYNLQNKNLDIYLSIVRNNQIKIRV